jgi:hypothetical protein
MNTDSIFGRIELDFFAFVISPFGIEYLNE